MSRCRCGDRARAAAASRSPLASPPRKTGDEPHRRTLAARIGTRARAARLPGQSSRVELGARQMHDTFAARAGRWSTRHRGMAIGLWLAFVCWRSPPARLPGLVTERRERGQRRDGEGRARDRRSDFPQAADESVLIQAPKRRDRRRRRVRAAVADVIATVRDQPRVAEVVSPYSASGADNISADRRSALVTFELRGTTTRRRPRSDAVVDRVERGRRAPPRCLRRPVRRRQRRGGDHPIRSTRTSSAPRRCRCR